MELDLRSFYTLFHEGKENYGGLWDPRLLEAYIFMRGLARIHAFSWKLKMMEDCMPYNQTET